jgi:hypothetical protein
MHRKSTPIDQGAFGKMPVYNFFGCEIFLAMKEEMFKEK